MVSVELLCYEFECDFENSRAYDVFKPYYCATMDIKSAIAFMNTTLLQRGRKLIRNKPTSETDKYALLKANLKLEQMVSVNCNSQPCRTLNLRTMQPIPPRHNSGYIGTSEHGAMQIKIVCPNKSKCDHCYNTLSSGKCPDKIVSEIIGKTFFAQKYKHDKQK